MISRCGSHSLTWGCAILSHIQLTVLCARASRSALAHARPTMLYIPLVDWFHLFESSNFNFESSNFNFSFAKASMYYTLTAWRQKRFCMKAEKVYLYTQQQPNFKATTIHFSNQIKMFHQDSSSLNYPYTVQSGLHYPHDSRGSWQVMAVWKYFRMQIRHQC